MFTAEQLGEIVRSTGLPTEIKHNENGSVDIDVESEDIRWTMRIGDDMALDTSVHLWAFSEVNDHAIEIANTWNFCHLSTILIMTDEETDLPKVDEDGEYTLILKWIIPYIDSVSKRYLESMISLWHEDVCEFLGLDELEDDQTVPSESEFSPSNDKNPISRLAQIQLELTVNTPQSTRELARSLKTSKYEINHILYHNTELFTRQGNAPPLWSNID